MGESDKTSIDDVLPSLCVAMLLVACLAREKDELDRIRAKVTEPPETDADARRRYLKKLSDERVRHWPNTLEAQRKKKVHSSVFAQLCARPPLITCCSISTKSCGDFLLQKKERRRKMEF